MAREVTLIVEDGTIVPNANSFVTEGQIATYARSRGVLIPALIDPELDAIAVLGIQAMDYLAVLPWRGEPVSPMQTTPWPRKNTGLEISETNIPGPIVAAQLSLSLFANKGIELIPGGATSGMVIKEKVGPIEQEYSETVGVSQNGLAYFPSIDLLLKPYLIAEPAAGQIGVGLWALGSPNGC